MQREAVLRNQILLDLTNDGPLRVPGLTLYVNSVGGLYDSSGRLVRYGLAKGSADLIGLWAPAGIFVSVEVKAPGEPGPRYHGKQKPSKAEEHLEAQARWMDSVNARGGIAVWGRSSEEIKGKLEAAKRARE